MKKLNTDILTNKFKVHLSDPENTRILFSGRFGVGKSSFLKDFFDNESNYYPVFLQPVNYSVATNEDIFELIKVDIIKQLYLKGDLEISVNKPPKISRQALDYFKSNPLKVSAKVASVLAKLTPLTSVLSETSKNVYDLIDDFGKFESQNKSGKAKLQEHLDQSSLAKGSFYEYDIISQLISAEIETISEKREPVLIIDDLDRLDPEHIFRILNVFSAHYLEDSNQHKFGFSKVVIVADVKNIELLYKHRYGAEADFIGYLDKFYSKEIFVFNNDETLDQFIFNELEVSLTDNYKRTLSFLLSYFVIKGNLKLRNIAKADKINSYPNFEIVSVSFKDLHPNVHAKMPHIHPDAKATVFSSDVPELLIVKYLIEIFGDFEHLKKSVDRMTGDGNHVQIRFLDDLAKSFALLLRLSEVSRAKNYYAAFFNRIVFLDQSNPQSFNMETSDFNDPIVNLFRRDVQISTLYSAGNKFDGTSGFYEGSSRVIHGIKGGSDILYSQVGEKLNSILKYLYPLIVSGKLGNSSA